MVKCAKCSKIVTKKLPGLLCCRCSKWFHAPCASISVDRLTALSNTDAVEWKCKNCAQSSNSKQKRLSFIVPDPEEEECDYSDQETSTKCESNNNMIKQILNELRKEIKDVIRQELQSTLKYYSDKLDEFTVKINTYEKYNKILENQCSDLKNNLVNMNLKHSVMESKICQIEQQLISNHLEICGIKEMEEENPEEISRMVARQIKQNPDDVIKAFRKRRPHSTVKAKQGESITSPITVVLREGARDQWIDSAKKIETIQEDLGLNMSGKLYLREALSSGISFLLWKTKQELKDNFKFIWCKNGSIMLRKDTTAKIVYIRSLSEVEALKRSITKTTQAVH